MSNRLFVITLVILLLSFNAYPIYQLFTTGGYLFYTNAFDETSYLQYDFSQQVQNISYVAQYIVTLAHNIGLSGGWINFIFDIISLLAFIIIIRGVLKQLGFDDKRANLSSFLIMALPLLFGGLNSVVNKLFFYSLSSGLINWITIPEASFLPIVRSPEPQLSLVVLSLSVYFSLKYKSFIPVYLCIPFLYPFIRVPFTFIVLSVHLRTKIPLMAKYALVPPLVSFTVLSSIFMVYFNFYVDNNLKESLVNSHYPLLSFTSSLALLSYLISYKGIPENLRYVVLMIALSPMVAANHQIVSGWIAQPSNFEQNFGIYCIVIVLILSIHDIAFQTLAGILALMLLLISAYKNFDYNYNQNSRLVLDNKMITELKTDSANVAVNDVGLASLLSMMFPRQPSSMFGYEKILPGQGKKNIAGYLCAKKDIFKDRQLKDRFNNVFKTLDHAYKFGNKDFILLHIGRKETFKVENNIELIPDNCPPANLHYFIVN